jgi:hypothetical protein
MWESRTNKRYDSVARVGIPGVLDGDVLLKNISITGCCVECPSSANISANSSYDIKIEPENESKVGDFVLPVECKWIQKGDNSKEIGFNIVNFPKGKLFQRYVDYLAYRSNIK